MNRMYIAAVVVVIVTIFSVVMFMGLNISFYPKYTQFEKIIVRSKDAWLVGNKQWNITENLENAGSLSATITDVYINDKSFKSYGNTSGSYNIQVYVFTRNGEEFLKDTGFTLDPGEHIKVVVKILTNPSGIPKPYSWTSGLLIRIDFHTMAGNTHKIGGLTLP